jgi:hypothetical protein
VQDTSVNVTLITALLCQYVFTLCTVLYMDVIPKFLCMGGIVVYSWKKKPCLAIGTQIDEVDTG